MTNEELDNLRQDIESLRKAVRKANPFLRAIVALRAYAMLSIPLGVLTLVFCLGSHFLVLSYGSFQAIPGSWKTPFWIVLGIFIVGSFALKWIVVARRAAQIEKGANFMTALKAMYGSSWANVNLPATISILVAAGFAVYVGRSWYIVIILAVFLGIVCNSVGLAVERKEYLVTGWYSLLSGLVALFFIESAPFLWTAVVWAGIFFVYAASGLHYMPREEKVG
jgi:hypothetical protein